MNKILSATYFCPNGPNFQEDVGNVNTKKQTNKQKPELSAEIYTSVLFIHRHRLLLGPKRGDSVKSPKQENI